MKVLRTPEERFKNIKDYSFGSQYVEVDAGDGTALRMHYVDEGQLKKCSIRWRDRRQSWLQDDAAHELSRAVIDFVRANPG